MNRMVGAKSRSPRRSKMEAWGRRHASSLRVIGEVERVVGTLKLEPLTEQLNSG
jgi:hypothetical protein